MRSALIKKLGLGILLFTFFATILVVIVTVKTPETIISFLQSLTPIPSPAVMQLKGVAVIGDSQSDEYRADDKRGYTYGSTTLNWVEQLEKYRAVNFGEWGVWEEPRRTGYEYNYARTGATTNSVLESGQHTGVAEKVKEGKVNLVIIYIGANDFAPYITTDGYESIYDGSITMPSLIRKENQIVADIKTMIDTVVESGDVKILLVKIPDWGNHLGIQIAFPIPTQRQRVTDAIVRTNTQLEKMADAYAIPTVDPNEFYKTTTTEITTSDLKVGEVKIRRTFPSDDPHSLFLDDGIHPGTIMNGLFANFLITNLSAYVGIQITPFTDSEILHSAGL